MKSKKCPLCDKKVYSGIGNGCKMCGMILELEETFCSKNCERSFVNLKKIQFI